MPTPTSLNIDTNDRFHPSKAAWRFETAANVQCTCIAEAEIRRSGSFSFDQLVFFYYADTSKHPA